MEAFEWLYELLFVTVFETHGVAFASIFVAGIAFGSCLAALIHTLGQKRAKKQVKETARVGRLRAKRAWDA